MRIRLVLFRIVRRPAAGSRRVTAIAAGVNTERQAELLGARIDRPVAAAADRLIGPRRDVDLHVLADPGAAFDLGDGEISAVLTDKDRGLQTPFAARPKRQLPIIDGALDRGAEFEVLLRED